MPAFKRLVFNMIHFVALTCAAYRRFVPHSPLHGIAPLTLWAVVSQLAHPACSSAANADSGTRPNIVVILADDQNQPVTEVGCIHGEYAVKSDRLTVI